MGMRENFSRMEPRKLRNAYRLHMTFAVGFAAFALLLSVATQSFVVPGLLGLFIIGGNGYAAYVAKQELNSRTRSVRR